jgi:hypothetical protein
LDRSLSTWAAAFTPAFLNPTTQQRMTADFDVMFSSLGEVTVSTETEPADLYHITERRHPPA